MKEFFLVIVALFMGIVSLFGWFAMMFASLPGAKMNYRISMRLIRGLFYIYPVIVVASFYFLKIQLAVSYYALLWLLGPIIPLFLVWLIFTINE